MLKVTLQNQGLFIPKDVQFLGAEGHFHLSETLQKHSRGLEAKANVLWLWKPMKAPAVSVREGRKALQGARQRACENPAETSVSFIQGKNSFGEEVLGPQVVSNFI